MSSGSEAEETSEIEGGSEESASRNDTTEASERSGDEEAISDDETGGADESPEPEESPVEESATVAMRQLSDDVQGAVANVGLLEHSGQSSLDIIRGISSDMERITDRLGGATQRYMAQLDPPGETIDNYARCTETVSSKPMQLVIVVDITAGRAEVTSGDPAAAAGLEVLCHGRPMIVTSSQSASHVSNVSLAESRRYVRAPRKKEQPDMHQVVTAEHRQSIDAPNCVVDKVGERIHPLPRQDGYSNVENSLSHFGSARNETMFVDNDCFGSAGGIANFGKGARHHASTPSHGRIVDQAISLLLDEDEEDVAR